MTSFGGYKNPKKIKRILDSTTSYKKYLLSPLSVWANLVWEYWNPPKICNKKVTTRLWYAAGPYWHASGSIGPYHSRVITYKYVIPNNVCIIIAKQICLYVKLFLKLQQMQYNILTYLLGNIVHMYTDRYMYKRLVQKYTIKYKNRYKG